MRILGLIAGLLLWVDAQSQVVVSMPEWPQAGLTGDVVAGLHIEPTPGGADPQSWDFGDVSGTAISLIAINPAETSPLAPAFPLLSGCCPMETPWDSTRLVLKGNSLLSEMAMRPRC